jgi:seryl-tRNA synthetase
LAFPYLLQSHDELQAKLNQLSDQLAEKQRGALKRMRVAKEAEKNLQGQVQSLTTELGKAHDRAKEKAMEWGDAHKHLSSNRGLLNKEMRRSRTSKRDWKQQSSSKARIWGRGPKMRASPPLMRGSWKKSRSF